MAVIMKLLRSDFRSYVHDPEKIHQWITARGFTKLYQNQTLVWLTQVYVKNS
jgi:hypothetical protein